VATASAIAGTSYLVWRCAYSVNPAALVLSILLLAAEIYSFLDSLMFALTMWRPLRRSTLPPIGGASVDVFITTYNESLEIVRGTAEAAKAIDWSPLSVYILDDGAREGIRSLAEGLGCGYITRGEEWKGKDRHAKAGNVNNALSQTSGEFILMLDADQIPDPEIVKKTVGYFRDPGLAFVQTPQSFYNLPPGDPFGSDAPLFYGPIMRGKDGWNAAFFCGSNALLRREALMRTGLSAYADAAESAFRASLRQLKRQYRPSIGDSPPERAQKRDVSQAVADAASRLDSGEALQAVSRGLKASLTRTCPAAVAACIDVDEESSEDFGIAIRNEVLAVEGVSTVSVTEDMATALRLHAAGWKSVFLSETLAYGLAPEDLGSALAQRRRWAQGTIQVLLRDSPLTKKGLSPGQRLMYFETIFSYFSGFASLVFLLCPLFYFFLGVSPVRAWNLEFFLWFLPFFALNRAMFLVAAEGLGVKRGEQYNLCLFPLWIESVLSVLIGKEIAFAVTPKTRQTGNYLGAIKVQIATVAITIAGIVFAAIGLLTGSRADLLGVIVNIAWSSYNIFQFIVILRAARYSPPADWNPQPPSFGSDERKVTA
jgi:cellulose synthase (UDP-forming)